MHCKSGCISGSSVQFKNNTCWNVLPQYGSVYWPYFLIKYSANSKDHFVDTKGMVLFDDGEDVQLIEVPLIASAKFEEYVEFKGDYSKKIKSSESIMILVNKHTKLCWDFYEMYDIEVFSFWKMTQIDKKKAICLWLWKFELNRYRYIIIYFRRIQFLLSR